MVERTVWQEKLETYARHVVKLMETYAREEWRFPEGWSIETVIRFSKPRVIRNTRQLRWPSSWGGRRYSRRKGVGYTPYVIIELGQFRAYNQCKDFNFTEYDHIKEDPEIGAIPNNQQWTRYVAALCAHEVAHVVQYCAKYDVRADSHSSLLALGSDDGGHGVYWQEIYRILRRCFVNSADVLPLAIDTPKPKKKHTFKSEDVIGTVEINSGWYRNRYITGVYTLIKGWTPKKVGFYNGEGKRVLRHDPNSWGYVTVQKPGRGHEKIRVTCYKEDAIETLFNKEDK